MKRLFRISKVFVLTSAMVFAAGAQAAGSHTGGHGHEQGANHGALTDIGKAGDPAQVSRTIKVDMNDAMRFTPDHIQVKAGETLRFVVTNSGNIRHEMVLGADADLDQHYQMMMKDPTMRHEEPNAISLDAGKSGEIIWQFPTTGRVSFGCLEPGHYSAGMKGAVSVQ